MEYSSSSSSESDSTFVERLHRCEFRKKKFPKATLKRNPRQGMCLLSGDEKSSDEQSNVVEIYTDNELDHIPIEILSNSNQNLVSLDDGQDELEQSMLNIDLEHLYNEKDIKK